MKKQCEGSGWNQRTPAQVWFLIGLAWTVGGSQGASVTETKFLNVLQTLTFRANTGRQDKGHPSARNVIDLNHSADFAEGCRAAPRTHTKEQCKRQIQQDTRNGQGTTGFWWKTSLIGEHKIETTGKTKGVRVGKTTYCTWFLGFETWAINWF